MNIFSWFRRNRKRKTEPEFRAFPKPIRVQLDDVQLHSDHFVRLPEWSVYRPVPVSWEIPNFAVQRKEIEKRIQRHAKKGTLDGLVPDLLDREIHHRCAEISSRIDAAHEQAVLQLTYYYEQGKLAQTDLTERVKELRKRQARSEREYRRAWLELTGEEPDDPGPRAAVISPLLLPLEVAYGPKPFPGPDTPVEGTHDNGHSGGCSTALTLNH